MYSKTSEFNPAADSVDPDVPFNYEKLLELAATRMPFGKYKGTRLVDLPEGYVVWFAQEGFPSGKLGDMLRTVYEIKVNGLEFLFDRLR
ncbi:MAG: DUF3820 family protein [Pseudomonadota bacterium]